MHCKLLSACEGGLTKMDVRFVYKNATSLEFYILHYFHPQTNKISLINLSTFLVFGGENILL